MMALCDRLEANLASVDEARRRLLEALLAEALAPDGERELVAAEYPALEGGVGGGGPAPGEEPEDYRPDAESEGKNPAAADWVSGRHKGVYFHRNSFR